MSTNYDEMQGSPTDVLDHPAHNHSDRQQLAGDIKPLSMQPSLAEIGKKTYDRELRRSPGDGTFRQPDSMNQDWDKFKAPLGK